MDAWRKYIISKHKTEGFILKELMESEAFCCGVSVGINIYQQKVVEASDSRKPLRIGDELYYVQTGRDRLKEMIKKICE